MLYVRVQIKHAISYTIAMYYTLPSQVHNCSH